MKRLFDIAFSLVSIILLIPVWIVVSLMIVIDSRGGIFFRQLRVGRNRKPFTILKFRTMYVRKNDDRQITVGKRDPRVTSTGQLLRRTKLDELPQLFNILAGDMSFVGPRPEVPKYVDRYNEEQLKTLNVRPGLVDYASLEYFDESEILGRADDPEREYIEVVMPAKLALSLKYMENRSFSEDLKILFRTAGRILGV